MTQAPLADVLADLAAPLAASLGLELWGIELAFGGRSLVRVFVEAEKGVSIEECAELSRLLGLTLEVEDLIPGAYVLEVSSPGLERTFFTGEQLARFVGQRVEITLRQPQPSWPGRRKFRGVLQKAPESMLPGKQEEEAAVARPVPSGGVCSPTHPVPGYHADLFILKAEDLARPDEEEPLIAFAFADLKKATLVHVFPDQALPAKGAGKKGAGGKAGKTSGNRRDSGARGGNPDAGEGETTGDDC